MGQEPFVWEVQAPRELLEEELAQLRQLPYSLWQEAIGPPRVKTVTGRDGRDYKVSVQSSADADANIRVTVALSGGGWRRVDVSGSFVITPDNQIIV